MFTGRKDVVQSQYISANNAAAIITVDEGPGTICRISRIIFSYSGAPTGGLLTLTANAITVFSFPVTAAGPGPLGVNVRGTRPIVITLAAGGAGIVGHLYVEYFDR